MEMTFHGITSFVLFTW